MWIQAPHLSPFLFGAKSAQRKQVKTFPSELAGRFWALPMPLMGEFHSKVKRCKPTLHTWMSRPLISHKIDMFFLYLWHLYLHPKWNTGRRGKRLYLLYALKQQNLGAYMCAVRKADTHICLRAAQWRLGVGRQVAAVSTSECGRDELGPEQRGRPWKRMAKLEPEGPGSFLDH